MKRVKRVGPAESKLLKQLLNGFTYQQMDGLFDDIYNNHMTNQQRSELGGHWSTVIKQIIAEGKQKSYDKIAKKYGRHSED
ncbi:MAG: hypothetical protein EOM59_22395 [Clostridia bacterium]|nr:hypothetical protein [Clostridia bacterium]